MRRASALAMTFLITASLWTGPVDADHPAPTVLITEVCPSPSSDATHEFVELHVPASSPSPVDLGGWTLTDNDGGPDLSFGRVTLDPGSYLVVWTSRPSHGPTGISIGRGSPIWNDGGDDVVLMDGTGRVRVRLAYGRGEAVDPCPDGTEGSSFPAPSKGRSLVLDPLCSTYIEADPSPGGPTVPVTPERGPPPAPERTEDTPKGYPSDEPPADEHPRVLIEAVHPGGSLDWEHVLLNNPGPGTVNVSGWRVDDGEGSLRIPEGATMGPGSTCGLAVNGTAFEVLWNEPPTWTGTLKGGFGLADRGDDLVLRDPAGKAVDMMRFGDCQGQSTQGWSGGPVATPTTMPWGRLLRRQPGTDTDSAIDWRCWTEPQCGWLPPREAVHSSRVEAACFVTPEGGWDHLAWVIASAEEELIVSLYDLTSHDLAAAMASRAREGVDARILVEGTPVGASPSETARREGLLAALASAGVDVLTTARGVPGSGHQPYRYHHEKWCVADGETVLVSTENWGPSSYPSSGDGGTFGSRGWGAVIEDAGLASALLGVFEHDIRWALEPWDDDRGDPVDLPNPVLPSGRPPRFVAAEASLLVGPEGWGLDLGTIVSLLDGAEEGILLELSALEVRWGEVTSPLVEALLRAAVRGVDVRLVLDPGFDGDGEDTLDELHLLASQRGLWNLRGVLASGLPDASRVHAKGALLDGRTAFLGSMNWARSSIARNREVVVVLESPEAVQLLMETFERDWNASTAAQEARVPLTLVEALLARWDAPKDRTSLGHSIGPPKEVDAGPGPLEEPWWAPWVRAVIVVSAAVSIWSLDRRFALSTRFWTWYVGRAHDATRWLRDLTRRRQGEGEDGPNPPPSPPNHPEVGGSRPRVVRILDDPPGRGGS